ncbi:2-acylglycerol O-acyltransferase 2-like [Planococcus citri]|uniref:2-acylglycerol O-acyltransferase 2-like n=1 Tax=Planococcus citri TaxID=170843 RepID=UPI0031F8A3F9
MPTEWKMELEMEVEYGPPLRDKSNALFRQTVEDYYDWLGCWMMTLTFIFGPPFLLLLCITTSLWIIGLLYFLWMYYDRETPHTGGRRLLAFRKLRFWRYRRNYFPIRLVKTAELPANTTYLFSSFPHGILVFGASTNFISDANHFDKAFPGLNPYIMTLNANFNFPFARELLLFFGVCAASARGILHVLNGPPGNVCVLMVGGVAEALKSVPGEYHIILRNRKGFVKMALKTGSSLVPVFSFGETDTYEQVSGKWYRWLQGKLRATTGIPLILVKGRGILSHSFRLLPHNRPITTVVGNPIKLPKEENPGPELVDTYHEIFTRELIELFEKYKVKYDSRGKDATLIIE